LACPVSLPRVRPPAQPTRAGAQRPLRVFCLRCLGLHGHGADAVARRTGAPGGLREASSPPAARLTPAPAATAASQAASGSRQAALRRSTLTACTCHSAARLGSAARRVPGGPAGEPWRRLPAAAGHSLGAGAAVGRGL